VYVCVCVCVCVEVGLLEKLTRKKDAPKFVQAPTEENSIAGRFRYSSPAHAPVTRRAIFVYMTKRLQRHSNNSTDRNFVGDLLLTYRIERMAPVKKDKAEISAFERKRLENIAANQAILKDLSTSAEKIMPKSAGRPKSTTATRKKATPVKRDEPRPTRTSSRIAGLEADSETAKRKAEVEYEFAKEQAKAKKQRVSGELSFNDIVVEGKKWNKDDNFLSGIMKGAQPNVRTFTEDDIQVTTNEGLKALRQKMSALELYEGYEPNRMHDRR
jgi:hypothetical protein